LVDHSKLGLPDKSLDSKKTQSVSYHPKINPEKVFFRPYHGIHLGVARNNLKHNTCASGIRLSHYRDFCCLEKEPRYKQIQKHFKPFVIEQIDKYHEMMRRLMNEE